MKKRLQGSGRTSRKLILPLADMGVPLAGWDGRNAPQIDDEAIRFNGLRHCGHPKNEDIVIPYPSEHAHGIGPSSTRLGECEESLVLRIDHRCCGGGRCSCESFVFPRIARPESDDEERRGIVIHGTKTAFRPYDVAVTAALIIAKKYLREKLVVHSDGLAPQWQDAKELCQQHLGYGDWFGIVEDLRVELWPGPNGTKVEREVRVRLLVEVDPASFLLP